VASASNIRSPLIKTGHKIMQSQTLRVYISSPGTIFDPFIPRTPALLAPLYKKEGWKERWLRLKSLVKTRIAIFTIKRRLGGWSPKDFIEEAESIYIQMNEALVGSDKSRLSELTTDLYNRNLRHEWNRLNYGKGLHGIWKYVGRIDRPRIVHVAVARTTERSMEFAQITVNLRSLQSFEFKSTTQSSVDGQKSPIPVDDTLIYERNLMDTNAQWRICAKLSPNT
jgi:hypothetical protein